MNRYVAFLDILGFADLVKEESLATVKSHVAAALAALEKSREAAPKLGFDEVAVRPVNVFSFSDTFVLLSDNESPEALLSFLSATIHLTRTLYAQALPVRGAVTFGEADFIAETNHAVGKAIVAAAEFEKKQHWFGVMLDEASFPASGKNLIAQKEFADVLLHWDVPVKTEPGLNNAMVINWRYNLELSGDIASLCRPSKKPDVIDKLRHTAAFESYLKAQNLHEGATSVRNRNGHEIYTPWLAAIPTLVR